MAALLDQEITPYPDLRRGDIVEGVVVGTDRDAVLVDIGAKSEGIVPPHEMHCLLPEGPSRLRPGDKVLVFVLQPESPEGQIILSLDRARGERGWRILQEYMEQNQAFEAYVTGHNKGGLLVNVEGVNAFVPLSQIAGGRPDRGSPESTERALAEMVGKPLLLKVIELNRRRNRAILSERAAVQERRAAQKDRLLQELKEGEILTGRISSIRDFGIFVDLGGADGLVHLSELSWERTSKPPQEMFRVGDEIEVYVLKVDQEHKKIALSVRRAHPQQWEELVSRFREGQVVTGQVTKLAPFGAFVRLEGPVEGLIHISELVDRRINHPKEVVEEGDIVPVKIVRIEYDRHRLGLSLRQAREKAEEDGWVFDEGGRVAEVPPEVVAQVTGEAEPSAQAPAETAEAPPAEAEAPAEAPAAEAPVEAAAEAPAEETEAPAEAAEAPPAEAEAPAQVEAQAEAAEPAPEAPAEPADVTEPAANTLNKIDPEAAGAAAESEEKRQEEEEERSA